MAPKNKTELQQVLDKLEIVHEIKTDVKLLKQNQETLKEAQDKTEIEIKNIYEKKASKSDMDKVEGVISGHIKGHGNWVIPLVCQFISGGIILLVAWLTLKG